MKLSRFAAVIVLASVICVSMIIRNEKRSSAQGHPPQKPIVAQTTLENMQSAYAAESGAVEKYLLYAAKADREGYKKAAQLFRAAAESQRIRAASHAKVIAGAGAVPNANTLKHTVKSTKENLEEAIKKETEEVEKIYPKFLTQAKADNSNLATMIFESSIKVSSNRVKLFKDALNNLQTWKTASAKGFFVCQMCGNLVQVVDFTDCPICGYPASEYKQIF